MPSSRRVGKMTNRTASGHSRPMVNSKTDKRLTGAYGGDSVRTGKTFSKNGKRYTMTARNADGGTSVTITHKGKSVGGMWYGRGLDNGAGATSRRQTSAMSSYAKNYFKKNSK